MKQNVDAEWSHLEKFVAATVVVLPNFDGSVGKYCKADPAKLEGEGPSFRDSAIFFDFLLLGLKLPSGFPGQSTISGRVHEPLIIKQDYRLPPNANRGS